MTRSGRDNRAVPSADTRGRQTALAYYYATIEEFQERDEDTRTVDPSEDGTTALRMFRCGCLPAENRTRRRVTRASGTAAVGRKITAKI